MAAKPPSQRSLDIFSVLRRFDMNDKGVRKSVLKDKGADGAKELDGFVGFLALRWMSSVEGHRDEQEFCLESVNELANIGYFSLSKHPELQAKVLAVSGSGKRMRHSWIAGPKRRGSNRARQVMLDLNPHLKDDEVEMMLSMASKEDVLDAAGRIGWDREEINKLKDEL